VVPGRSVCQVISCNLLSPYCVLNGSATGETKRQKLRCLEHNRTEEERSSVYSRHYSESLHVAAINGGYISWEMKNEC
jgi:hypothetical protein